MNLKKALHTAVLAGLLTGSVLATGGDSSGGGNFNAAEFTSVSNNVIDFMEKNKRSFPEVSPKELRENLKNTGVLFKLEVRSEDYDENTSLHGHSEDGVIEVEEPAWVLSSQTEKRVLACHEMLVLAGIEDRDNYPVCSRLFDMAFKTKPKKASKRLVDENRYFQTTKKSIFEAFYSTQNRYMNGEINEGEYSVFLHLQKTAAESSVLYLDSRLVRNGKRKREAAVEYARAQFSPIFKASLELE